MVDLVVNKYEHHVTCQELLGKLLVTNFTEFKQFLCSSKALNQCVYYFETSLMREGTTVFSISHFVTPSKKKPRCTATF